MFNNFLTIHTLASTPENPKYKVKSRIADKENKDGMCKHSYMVICIISKLCSAKIIINLVLKHII